MTDLPLSVPLHRISGSWETRKIDLQVLRLDMLHPIVSGNKLFKLQEWLRIHQAQGNRHLITFGGAWSNHLLATAYACKELEIPCTGIVRGEKPDNWTATLLECRDLDMQLEFIPRSDYAEKNKGSLMAELNNRLAPVTIVPEGGFSREGALGAADICRYIPANCTHLCCAAGTGTMTAGLLMGKQAAQKVVAFPVLKGLNDLTDRVFQLSGNHHLLASLSVIRDAHQGGYARFSEPLLAGMNEIFQHHGIPTDFVYTGKMMTRLLQLLQEDFFPPGSQIVAIHSGGLQGNRSLAQGRLLF